MAKAVIALANSSGGVVLVGVDNEGRTVGLEASDPNKIRLKKGPEDFRRHFLQTVLIPKKGWNTSKGEIFELSDSNFLERLIKLEEIRCGDKSILAIFVDLVPFCYVDVYTNAEKKSRSRLVYVRRRGEIGEVVELSAENMQVDQAHKDQRTNYKQEVIAAWNYFRSLILIEKPIYEIEPIIKKNITKIIDQFSHFDQKFVPLKASHRQNARYKSKRVNANIPGFGEDWLKELSKKSSKDEKSINLRSSSYDKLNQGNVIELLGKEDRALLIGEPGSGKSVCIGMLALKVAKGWQSGQTWPLLISLAEYSDAGLSGLLQERSGIVWDDLYPQIVKGKVALYLDALNECPNSLYESCQNEILSLLTECPEASIYVSTRSSELTIELELPIFEINPMDIELQRLFLSAYLSDDQQSDEILTSYFSNQVHL